MKKKIFQNAKAAVLVLAIGAAAAAQPAWSQTGPAKMNSRVFQQDGAWIEELTGQLPAASSVRVNSDAGLVRIQGGNQQEVTFTIRKRVQRVGSEEIARRELQGFNVWVGQKGDVVVFYGNRGSSHRTLAEFVINIPQQTQWAKVDTRGGSVLVKGISGSVVAHTAGGSISLDEIGGTVKAVTAGGSIELGKGGGDAVLETAGGWVKVGEVGGSLKATTSGGSISVGKAAQWVRAETMGGTILVKQTGGELRASTAGGNIECGDIGGPAVLDTAGGSIRLRSAKGGVHANTAGGGIRLAGVSGGVRASTAAGSIFAEFHGGGAKFGESHLETTMGDIIVYLPADLGVTVSAYVEMPNGHKILTDFPGLKIKSEEGIMGMYELYGEGALNGGGPLLKVHAVTGNIEFRLLKKFVDRQAIEF